MPDDRKNEENERRFTSIAWSSLAVAIGIQTLYGFLIWRTFNGEWGKAGTFGDSFGAVTALFSGLALGGVILTVLMQTQELRYQREELQLTRNALEESALAQQQSAEQFEQQNELARQRADAEAQAFFEPIGHIVNSNTRRHRVFGTKNYSTVQLVNRGKTASNVVVDLPDQQNFTSTSVVLMPTDTESGRSVPVRNKQELLWLEWTSPLKDETVRFRINYSDTRGARRRAVLTFNDVGKLVRLEPFHEVLGQTASEDSKETPPDDAERG